MSTQVIRNSRGNDEPPQSPLHEDGTRYPFAMQFDGGKFIGYADTPAELLGMLIEGYEDLEHAEQQTARIRLAVKVQVAVQAVVNSSADPAVWDALSGTEKDVLNGPRFEQPHGWAEPDDEMGDVWDSEIPLVLVETGYAPYTDIDRPISGIADVLNPPNIVWLRPVDEMEFLTSIADAEYVELFEATDL